MSNTKLRIVILGYIVRGPLGGLVWHHLQYVLGLKQMGHEVLFLEDSEDYPTCYDPRTNQMSTDPAYGLTFLKEIFGKYGLDQDWAYYDHHTNRCFGMPKKAILDYCSSADLLLNLSGVNPLREWTYQIPIRAFIDTDPAFIQIRHLTNTQARQLAELHTCFFTFGELFGQKNCGIPDDGLPWIATRQPIVLDLWKPTRGSTDSAWTTVMQWDSYKSLEYEGREYGMKSVSFNSYWDLPKQSAKQFTLAMGSASAPLKKIQEFGWKLENALKITETPESYQTFIQHSKGEWSIAKQGYVQSKSGWFSERSAVYLASGRPVVVQDTGFSDFLDTGKGLFAFNSLKEAIDQLEEIEADYQEHCVWARQFAHDFFKSSDVLERLIGQMV